jgi:hypothetical protein
MVYLYSNSFKGITMIKIKNWHMVGLLAFLFLAGQLTWYLTSKGII